MPKKHILKIGRDLYIKLRGYRRHERRSCSGIQQGNELGCKIQDSFVHLLPSWRLLEGEAWLGLLFHMLTRELSIMEASE